mmetsp:Transcript_1193/g.3157  ORF Transcript_1193/g.3157 Transcript_1193/m.3157 type:complete len:227 (+) Transcript_1193:2166-2846(+)
MVSSSARARSAVRLTWRFRSFHCRSSSTAETPKALSRTMRQRMRLATNVERGGASSPADNATIPAARAASSCTRRYPSAPFRQYTLRVGMRDFVRTLRSPSVRVATACSKMADARAASSESASSSFASSEGGLQADTRMSANPAGGWRPSSALTFASRLAFDGPPNAPTSGENTRESAEHNAGHSSAYCEGRFPLSSVGISIASLAVCRPLSRLLERRRSVKGAGS